LKYYNYGSNPCINNDLIDQLHLYNLIDILHINSIIVKKGNKTNEIICTYDKNTIDNKNLITIDNKNLITNKIIIHNKIHNKANHFYFSSFNIDNNREQLHNEMSRLFLNRDSYKNIYIHLDNNHGGQNIPVHLILRCLVGNHEKWMKPIIRLENNKFYEYNCWNEDEHRKNSWEYKMFKKLNIEVPKYETKYKGKIHLYMHNCNGSASWYFITYMIYAFGLNIKNYTKKCYGQN
jgi:hypothetical protein